MSAILAPAPGTRPAPTRSDAYDLLFAISDVHRDWILDSAEELELPAGTVLIEEGRDIGHLSILIDYFNDQLVVKLSNYAHQLLKPDGRVIFGNFQPANPANCRSCSPTAANFPYLCTQNFPNQILGKDHARPRYRHRP